MPTIDPVRPDWRISEVLRRYPNLLDVLIDTSPAFRHLRNPVMRRVQTRLVTVEQAARIAGLQPGDLVATLNRALGVEDGDGDPAEPVATRVTARSAPPDWLDEAPVAAELDVRPLQERGEEPFSAIMATVRQVPEGRAFRLRSAFEPVPLYDLLAQRGFEHWTTRHADDDWEILFCNTGRGSAARRREAAAPRPARASGWASPTATITIDVSELVPPEPMIRILEALEALPPGGSLLVHHLRRPMHLYPRLDELGYRHETRELAPDRVEILIEKPAGVGPEAQ